MRLGKISHVENVVDVEDINVADIHADNATAVIEAELLETR